MNSSDILLIACIGLGNSVLSLPLLSALKKEGKSGHIDVLTMDGASPDIFALTGLCRDIFQVKGPIGRRLALFKRLRERKYDLCFLTFPTLASVVLLFPYLAGSRFVVGHDYRAVNPFFRYFVELYHELVPIQEDLHDVEQNLRLAFSFLSEGPRDREYPDIRLAPDAMMWAQHVFKEENIGSSESVFCFHPGSKLGTDYKRWPLDRFIDLADRLQSRYNARCLFILGPDETEFRDRLAAGRFSVVQSTILENVMAVIDKCDYFISNDSGIMHVASLLHKTTFTIWGGTDIRRNGSRSRDRVDILNPEVDCRPCVKILPERQCECDFMCIRSISVDHVFNAISDYLAEKPVRKAKKFL